MSLLLFLFGLIFGSFLNVCIHRIPKNESVAFPGSHCPECDAKLAWYDNIPLLSFLALRGKCRSCHTHISKRYPIVELVSGIIWVVGWTWFGASIFYAEYLVFSMLLLALAVIDWETGFLPDELTLTGMVVGLILCIGFPILQETDSRLISALRSAGGLLLGGGVIYVIGIIGEWIFKKEAMGGGDIKLLAMIGAFVGPTGVILTFFLAPFLALPHALLAKIRNQAETIPYGPALVVAGFITFLVEDPIWTLLISR
jgi:leader peptidase (prepilin peptidase)/N-methyltransferase